MSTENIASRIVARQAGGPEAFELERAELAPPGAGEALIRQTAIGLNFIDVYFRTGLYAAPGGFPLVVGQEAAGVVEAVGEGVDDLKPGDRVAYCGALGAYADRRLVPARVLVKLPDFISDELAASIMLKGLTAQYLLRQTYRVQAGETIVFHAAAGGTGSIACQWASHLGARVIGTVGSPEKAEIARANGCAEVVLYKQEDLPARVRELTGGQGVPVVYDGIGAKTFLASLDCLQPRGLLVSFGNASGPVENVNLGILAAKGSLYVTRPAIATYTATREMLLSGAADLFAAVEAGAIKLPPSRRFPLAEAGAAQRELEAGTTAGSTILIP
jgi:NADPH2:quinone reductase